MGAGENALFEIFSTIYAAGEGALLVLDEIELGLHAAAQRRFIERLKDICLETYTQVICTTHSKEIFDCLPADARFYVETIAGKTRLTEGISSDFAFAKMSAIAGNELDIFIEDDVAKSILLSCLPSNIRSRATFCIIGSANALARQLAALYVRGETKPTLAIFDGDQLAKAADLQKHAKNMAENAKPDFSDWFQKHSTFLPGDMWPEAWLLNKADECVDAVAASVGTDAAQLSDYIEYGRQAGKHNELYEIAKHLGLERSQVLQMFTSVVCQNFAEELSPIGNRILETLAANG